MRTAAAGAWACLGLQVSTVQAMLPALCGNCDGWVQEQFTCILQPLQVVVPPLSSVAFKAGMQLLCTDLATQYAARSEERELAQYVDWDAHDGDHCDAPQTFKG